MPELFDQLKQKYQPVLDAIQKEGAELQNVNLDGNQLYLKATAVSEPIALAKVAERQKAA
jgi:hypothetical protein